MVEKTSPMWKWLMAATKSGGKYCYLNALLALAMDKKFSYRMRRKFEEVAWRFRERDEWFRSVPGHQAGLPESGGSL